MSETPDLETTIDNCILYGNPSERLLATHLRLLLIEDEQIRKVLRARDEESTLHAAHAFASAIESVSCKFLDILTRNDDNDE